MAIDDPTTSADRACEPSRSHRRGLDIENTKEGSRRPDEGLAGAGSSGGSRDAGTRMSTPAEVLGSIFKEFANRRKQTKVEAWIYLQQALAENAAIICPSAVSLKDLISATANIEDLLKGQSGDSGKSPAEVLEEWLSSSSDKVVQ